MSKYSLHYCALLNSIEQLDYCREAQSLDELLLCIKRLWNCHQLSNEELLCEIACLNQTPIASTTTRLAGNWLAYRYDPKRSLVSWLLPTGHATEPFFDEYISRCRQQLFNQIIQPCTSLTVAYEQAAHLEPIQPAGFIFHLSRCGSTLISGCLSELESTCVFSESPLLTELLLDNQLTLDEHKKTLQAFIDLQAGAFSHRPQMIIKWNAWDIFRWDLIHETYPNVPVIFLVRDPIEILASHYRSAGRHMSGDATLASFHPVFSASLAEDSMLDKQVQVLHCLLREMNKISAHSNIMVIDYQHWSEKSLASVLNFFRCEPHKLDFLKVQERMRFHSKSLGQVFVADKAKKQSCFAPMVQERIRTQLSPTYNQLNKSAEKVLEMVINVY